MGAYRNVLREEGSREDLLRALEKAWSDVEAGRVALVAMQARLDRAYEARKATILVEREQCMRFIADARRRERNRCAIAIEDADPELAAAILALTDGEP